MTAFQAQLSSVEKRVQVVEVHLDKERDWQNEVWRLQRNDLEDRSWRDNVQILGIPEQMENNYIMVFFPDFLSKTLEFTSVPPLELQ